MSDRDPIDDGIPAEVYHRRWFILGVLCTALLVIVVANTSMNVALPTLARELGLDASAQQWVVDAYALSFAGLLFTAGALGDRFGRKGCLLAGLSLFGAGSVYATLVAGSGAEVIAARAAMGVGGALVMPTTLSILVSAFPARERARAIAVWSGIAGGGGAAGLLLGGWLAEHYWWGAPFAVNVPVAAAAVAVGAWLLPTSREPDAARVDAGGAVLSFAGLSVLVLGLIEGPRWGWGSASTVAALAGGTCLLAAFTWWERRCRAPMLDLALLRDRRFGVSSLGITLVNLVMFGFFYIGVQYLQLVAGYGPFASGLRMLPFVPVTVAASMSTPWLVRRLGPRAVVATGMLLSAIGVLAVSRLTVASAYGDLLPGMLVTAAGMGLTFTPLTELIMGSVPRHVAGVGSAMNDTTRELGTALGVAVLGSVLSSSYAHGVAGAADALPEPARDAATHSLGGALAVAQTLDETSGDALATAARVAFSHGANVALAVGAGIILATTAVVLAWLPRRGLPAFDLGDDFDIAVTAAD